MIDPTGKSLKEFFKSQGFAAELLHATKEFPFDVVFVYPGDIGEDKTLIQIRIGKQDMTDMEEIEGLKVAEKGYVHLQFSMPVNVKVKDEAIFDLYRLIHSINKSSEIPGFEFTEAERAVFYRYVMMVTGDGVDPYVLITIVGMMTTFYMTFEGIIKEVAAGVKTYPQAIQEIIDTISKAAKGENG